MATRIYQVQNGDYLAKIAAEQLGDAARWPEIAFLNNLKHPYTIHADEIIELPPKKNSGLIVEVTKGDNATPEQKESGIAPLVVAGVIAWALFG